MSLFVDASALVAIIGREPGARELEAELEQEPIRLTSGVALWEAARALGKANPRGIEAALSEIERYRSALAIDVVEVSLSETAEAVLAHARYGKGNHAARLNLGDCFAYACARTNGAKLLYKGDDFAKTDLA